MISVFMPVHEIALKDPYKPLRTGHPVRKVANRALMDIA